MHIDTVRNESVRYVERSAHEVRCGTKVEMGADDVIRTSLCCGEHDAARERMTVGDAGIGAASAQRNSVKGAAVIRLAV